MRYTLKLHGTTVGWSELESFDPVERRAWGPFRPGIGYALVQPIFALFSEAVPMKGGEPRDKDKLDRYYAARDRLGLELYDGSGSLVEVGAIHVAEYGSSVELEVLVGEGWVVDS